MGRMLTLGGLLGITLACERDVKSGKHSIELPTPGAVPAQAPTPGAADRPTEASSDPALRAAFIRSTQEGAPARFAWQRNADGWISEGDGARFKLKDGALEVAAPRKGSWKLGLETRSIGRGETAAPAARGALARESRENSARIARGTVVERFISGPLGVEHLYELATRPAGEGPLSIELQFSGLRAVSSSPSEVHFADSAGVVQARYSDLFVQDADGRAVTARLEVLQGSRVRLLVEDGQARYPLVVDPLVATQEATLAPADGASGDLFGLSVALTSDGSRALIGAPHDDVGAQTDAGTARVFRRTGSSWTPEATLQASGAATDDKFGLSVALSADGSRALVGAHLDDIPSPNRVDAGTARVFVRSGTTWTQEAILQATGSAADDMFGFAVALSADGSRALVGANEDDTGAGADAGSARVFVRSGSTWTQEATLQAASGAANDGFGSSVALTPDASRALVGAPADDSAAGVDSGSAHVFTRSGSSWTQEASLTAPDAAANDLFGLPVAVSADGARALIGVVRDDTTGGIDAGSARAFLRTGSSWSQEATLKAAAGAANDNFGLALALSSNATRAVVGAPFDNAPTDDEGTVNVFVRTGSDWTQDTVVQAGDAAIDDSFGLALAMSADGTRFLAGVAQDDTAPKIDNGTVRSFTLALMQGGACVTGADCASGNCVDGVCCDSACGGGASDCQACSVATGGTSDGTCTALASAVAATTVCRPAGGSCDAAEFCSAATTTCPVDGFVSASSECRASAGACDVAETCSGNAADCPADALVNAGSECRASAGGCDVAEACTGSAAACPADVLVSAGSQCRASAGVCDAAEACTGSSAACPADAFANAGSECRASAGACDTAEACTGSSASCPEDGFVAVGTECRASAGACDVTEACTGSGAACPADTLASAGTSCRPSAGACDPAEACTGDSTTCPSDALLSAGTACRPSAGACDIAEACTGASTTCPTDAFVSIGTECRASAGDCDLAESCPGNAAACPVDALVSAGTSCRTASCSNGTETPAADCSGSETSCPAPTTTACAPYVCEGTSCAANCASDPDCASGHFCSAAQTCVPQLPDGATCTNAGQCVSGTCEGGLCGQPVVQPAAVPAMGQLGTLLLGAMLLLGGGLARKRRK